MAKKTKKPIRKAAPKATAARATTRPPVRATTAKTETANFKTPQPRGADLVAEVVRYRGNVPLQQFAGWVLLVLLGVSAVGLLTAQLLVSQRQNQLIEETAARVDLQGQSRARLLGEWLEGLVKLGDSVAGSQLVRLYSAEMGGENTSGMAANGLKSALAAQQPYMQQVLRDLVGRNGLESAHLIAGNGQILVSDGPVPEKLVSDRTLLERLRTTNKGEIMPVRPGKDAIVIDIVRPVRMPADGDDAPVIGALWYSMPVGDKLADLLAATPLDRPGERTALIEQLQQGPVVVGRTSLAPIGSAFEDFKQGLASGRALTLSVVDGKATFAGMAHVKGTSFHVLQEYKAADALALMNLYKPGLYTIVALGVVVLAAFMLAMTVHLMAQRNKVRVKLLGQTMEALVRAVEARDPHLAGHHAKVARLSVAVGNRMGLPVGERATLFYAAQLAAVGRLLVPRDLLGKAGTLTPQERKMLEADVAKAHGILEGLDFDLPIVPVIGQMYERVDGSGHPGGLKGEAISRMARVLGTVDAYVALTADRSYRKAMGYAKAQQVLGDSGKFDPAVVSALKGLR